MNKETKRYLRKATFEVFSSVVCVVAAIGCAWELSTDHHFLVVISCSLAWLSMANHGLNIANEHMDKAVKALDEERAQSRPDVAGEEEG